MRIWIPLLVVAGLATTVHAAMPPINPYAPAHDFKTARLTIRYDDGRERQQLISNGVHHDYDDPDGSYSLSTPQADYNILPAEKKMVRFPSAARMFADFYATLTPAQQAQVDKNIASLGPHIEFDAEARPKRLPNATIAGKDCECYRYTLIPGDDEMAETKCYWQRILMRSEGILGSREVVKFETDIPLDDALFAVPTDYAVDANEEVGLAVAGKYAVVFLRLPDPGFTLQSLDHRTWDSDEYEESKKLAGKLVR